MATIPEKDTKILWARAVGRCSMPNCRVKLTLDSKDSNKSLTLGEMCHIVGEKNDKKSPRGISKLSEKDRNKYSNLILLCAHCHTIIDKNEKDWPIELLHKIKFEHELWVEECTSGGHEDTPERRLYNSTIDTLGVVFKLEQWNWFSENAIRGHLDSDYIFNVDWISERLIAIDWPNKNTSLETSIRNVMKAYVAFIEHYMKYSSPHRGSSKMLGPDASFKSIFPNPQYNLYSDRLNLWMQNNYCLLCLFTYEVNNYIKMVRKHINAYYFIEKSQFVLIDDLGVSNGGNAYMWKPTKKAVQYKMKEMEARIQEFEKRYNTSY